MLGKVVATSYVPTWIEVAVAAGIVGFALLGFTLGVRHLLVYSEPHSSRLH